MSTRLSIVTAVLSGSLLLAPAPPAAASVSVGVDIGFFHDSLSPYGDWIQTARFGLVWTPRQVDPGWRPYTYGHWAYTDYDWTWVSDEAWGWATYHYGRWAFDPSIGWVWVPGDEWAPAWVAWRADDDYVGWAPLPPGADAFGVGVGFSIDPFAFSFVRVGRLCDPYVHRYFVPVSRNVVYVRRTRDCTRYSYEGRHVRNHGYDVHRVERYTRRAVPRTRVREMDAPRTSRGSRSYRGGASAETRRFDDGGGRPTTRRTERSRPETRSWTDGRRESRRLDVRPSRPEARPSRPDVRAARPESRRSRSEVRPPRFEVRSPRPEVRSRRPEARSSRPEVRSQRPERPATARAHARTQESRDRSRAAGSSGGSGTRRSAHGDGGHRRR
jgi:hypothetical protein